MKITPNIISSNIYKLNSTVNSLSCVSNYQSKVETSALECLANYNVPFGISAVYAVDYDGSSEKFCSVKALQEQYGRIAATVLGGKVPASQNKTFVYADDIELPDGKIDTNALKMVLNNFKFANIILLMLKSPPLYFLFL